MAAEHNNGVFPPTLRGEQGVDGIMQRAIKTLSEKPAKDSDKMLMLSCEIDTKLRMASAVLNTAPPDAWRYAGKDIKLGTLKRPILWFKPLKTTAYQVIYADLSIKEVSPEEAPKLPQPDASSKP